MTQFIMTTPNGSLYRNDNTVAVSNTTTETTLYGATLAAGALSPYNRIKFTLLGTLSTAAVLPGTLTFRMKYASGTVAVGGGAITLIGGASNTAFRISGRIANKGGTASQLAYLEISQGSGGLSLGSPINQQIATLSVDSTASQTWAITAQFGTASASNAVTMQDFEMEMS